MHTSISIYFLPPAQLWLLYFNFLFQFQKSQFLKHTNQEILKKKTCPWGWSSASSSGLEEALPTTKKDFQALSVPRGYLGPALAHSRLLSLLAGFVKLAKHTCFSAGLMNSAGAVQHKQPRRESKSRQPGQEKEETRPLPSFDRVCTHMQPCGSYQTHPDKNSPVGSDVLRGQPLVQLTVCLHRRWCQRRDRNGNPMWSSLLCSSTGSDRLQTNQAFAV